MTAPLRFTVPGNPVSTNALYRSGGRHRYSTREGIAWKRAVALTAKAAGARPLTGPVEVRLHLVYSSRRPDLDNGLKGILDALTGVTWADDRQVAVIVATKGLDPLAPRAEVEVRSMEVLREES